MSEAPYLPSAPIDNSHISDLCPSTPTTSSTSAMPSGSLGRLYLGVTLMFTNPEDSANPSTANNPVDYVGFAYFAYFLSPENNPEPLPHGDPIDPSPDSKPDQSHTYVDSAYSVEKINKSFDVVSRCYN